MTGERGADQVACVWTAGTGDLRLRLRGHVDAVRGAAYSPDGSAIVTWSEDGELRVWDSATGTCTSTLHAHTPEVRWGTTHVGGITAAAFIPGTTMLVTTAFDHTAAIWDIWTGHEVSVLAGHTDRVNGVAVSPDGRWIATCSDDATVRLWPVELPAP
jgi:WD40 repeat protein